MTLESIASPHFFVLGTGRCGSTLLSNVLRAHPEVLSLSELFCALGGPRILSRPPLCGRALWELLSTPDAELRELLLSTNVPELLAQGSAPRRAALAPLLLVTLPHLSDAPETLWLALRTEVEAWPRAPIAEHLGRLCDRLRSAQSRRLWIERSGGSIEYADQLARAFPQARFVHLVRDGRACALSMSKHAFFRVHLARVLSRDPARSVADCLRDDLPVDRFGAYWSLLMHKTERTWRRADGKAPQLMLRYERLVSQPARELKRLGDFLAIEHGRNAWTDSLVGMIRRPEASLEACDAVQRRRLERACLPGMRILERLDALS